MTSSVVVVAPASPPALADMLHERDGHLAQSVAGLGAGLIADLVRALVSAGMSVEVVTLARGVDEPMVLDGHRLRLLVGPYRERARDRTLDLFASERAALQSLISQTSGELLHAHWTYEFAWAAQGDSRPVLVTAHDAPLSVLAQLRDTYRVARTLMAYVVRARIHRLTVVSPYLGEQWRKQMLFRGAIDVIPNPVPFRRHVSEGLARRPSSVVAIGDGTRLKNMSTLLRAFPAIQDAVGDAELTLVGPGLGPADDLASSFGTLRGVTFAGVLPRTAVLGTLAECAAYVHPSLEEACSVAVIEAMDAGCAIVGGVRSGGVPWLLDNGAGLLVDVTNPGAIAQAVVKVLTDRRAAEELSATAKTRAEALFAPQAVAASYAEAYDRVLSDRERSRLGRAG